MRTVRWCTVHDSAWDAFDSCEAAIIADWVDTDACRFVTMKLTVLR